MYLASSYSRYPPVHTRHQVLRKCCGLVHLRTGAILTCLVWATLSFYFAILSFQNTSIFFSYLPSGGAIAFRVSNVLLGGVSLGGLLTVIADKPDLLRPFSHAAWVSVFAVLVSGFVNGVLFITHYDAYQAWCIQVSSQSILQSVAIEQPDQTIGFALDKDYYNCDGLWRDETKFSSVAIVLMVVLYVYLAACLHSLCHKRAVMLLREKELLDYNGLDPHLESSSGASKVIVLNNLPPHKKSSLVYGKKHRNAIHGNATAPLLDISMHGSVDPAVMMETHFRKPVPVHILGRE